MKFVQAMTHLSKRGIFLLISSYRNELHHLFYKCGNHFDEIDDQYSYRIIQFWELRMILEVAYQQFIDQCLLRSHILIKIIIAFDFYSMKDNRPSHYVAKQCYCRSYHIHQFEPFQYFFQGIPKLCEDLEELMELQVIQIDQKSLLIIKQVQKSSLVFFSAFYMQLYIVEAQLQTQMKIPFGVLLLFFLASLSSCCKSGCAACDFTRSVCYLCSNTLAQKMSDGSCAFVQTPIPYCQIYNSSSLNCVRCQVTYVVASRVCIPDNTGCLRYSFSGQCLQCGFGMSLFEGGCVGVLNCKEYQVLGVNTYTCKSCFESYSLIFGAICQASIGCGSQISQKGGCPRCQDGYIKNGYNCYPQGIDLGNCAIYGYVLQNSTSLGRSIRPTCLYCWEGYTHQNENCVPSQWLTQANFSSIPLQNSNSAGSSVTISSINTSAVSSSGVIIQNDTMVTTTTTVQTLNIISNCLTYDSTRTRCLSCSSRYYVNSSGQCQSVSNICEKYIMLGGMCLSCINGYDLINGFCYQSIANCLRRNNYSASTCQECREAFSLTTNATACVAFCETRQSNNVCLSCPRYYSLNNGLCYRIVAPDQNCLTYVNNKCTACVNRFYVQNGTCKSVSRRCIRYNGTNGRCQVCISGFDINAEGLCLDINCQVTVNDECDLCLQGYYITYYRGTNMTICTRIPIPRCESFSNNQCTKCIGNFTLQNGSCISAVLNCLNYDNNGRCISCIQNYKFANEICVDENCLNWNQQGGCIQCISGFYTTVFTILCTRIPIPRCESFSNNQCTKCIGNFTLQNGSCISAVLNCLNYDNNGRCISCIQNYKFANEICVDENCLNWNQQGGCIQCISGFYTTVFTILCTRIPIPRCESFSNNQCTKCIGNFTLQNGSCISAVLNCLNYDNNGRCISCIQNYKFANEICVDENCLNWNQQGGCIQCISGFYTTVFTILCTRIPIPRCESFSNNQCTKCIGNFTLQNGSCISAVLNCLNYDNNGRCISCIQNYKFANEICVDENCLNWNQQGGCIQCISGFYTTVFTILCTRIPIPRCESFSNNQCTKCIGNFTLQNGSCISAVLNCLNYDNNGRCISCIQNYKFANEICVDENCLNWNQQGGCIQCISGFYTTVFTILCTRIPIPRCESFSNNQCTKCIGNFTLQNGSCISAVLNCLNYDNNGRCISCIQNYKFANEICVDENCLNWNQQGGCIQCISGFYTTVFTILCTRIPIPRCESFSNNQCTKCIGNFTLQNGSCISAVLNCLNYDNNGRCISCIQNYKFANEICVDENCLNWNQQGGCIQCISGFYTTVFTILCTRIPIPRCESFSNNQCTKCIGNFTLQNGSCISAVLNCLNYDNNGRCISCIQNYKFANEICVDENCLNWNQQGGCIQCISGFYTTVFTILCTRIPIPRCESFSNNQCTKCIGNFTLQNGSCISAVLNCLNYDNNGRCISCIQNYKFANEICVDENCLNWNQQGGCIQCISGFYTTVFTILCTRIPIPRCESFSNNQCTKCIGNFTLQNGSCISAVLNCLNYDNNGRCISCIQNYKFANEICVDENCLNWNQQGGCIQCISGFYTTVFTILCTRIPIPRCESFSNNQCTKCIGNFTLQNGSCISAVLNCLNYDNNGRCISCIQNYKFANEICVDENCLNWNQQGGCIQCISGFYTTVFTILCTRIPIPRCESFSNNQCTKCIGNFTLQNGSCISAVLNCLNYDNNGRCISCIQNYKFANEICVDENCLNWNQQGGCIQCISGFYTTVFTILCTRIPIPRCESFSNNQCTKCIGNFTLQNGSCISAVLNCLNYDNNGRCISCIQNYKFANEICVDENCLNWNQQGGCIQCISGFYTTVFTILCTRIPIPRCESFSNNQCTKCIGNFTLQNGSCISAVLNCLNYDNNGRCISCIQNYKFANEICVDENCLNWNQQGGCIQCISGFYTTVFTILCTRIPIPRCESFSNNQCTKCIGNFTLQNGSCISAVLNCLNYDNNGRCISCIQNYKFANEICVDENCLNWNQQGGCIQCISGFYTTVFTILCTRIPIPRCESFSNNQCTKCIGNFTLQNGSCISAVLNCLNYDNNGRCISCIQNYKFANEICVDENCLNWNQQGGCIQCISGFYTTVFTILCTRIPIPRCESFSNNQCTKCIGNFTLQNGSCISAVLNCLNYDNNGRCISCIQNYKFANEICVDENCLNWNQQGGCIQCISGFQITPESTTSIIRCRIIDYPNCAIAGPQFCLQCLPNFTLSLSRSCVSQIAYCATYNSSGSCTSCIQNYILQNRQCISVNAFVNCQVFGQTSCSQCSQGYSLVDGVCSLSKQILNCVQYGANGACVKCSSGYFLSVLTGQCNVGLVLVIEDRNCVRKSSTGTCSECIAGYGLNSDLLCVKVTIQDPNCIQTGLNGSCVVCNSQYYNSNGKCLPNNPLCAKSDPSNGQCLSCLNGFVLSAGNCIASTNQYCRVFSGPNCLECLNRYYLNSNGICVAVSSLCINYNNLTGACISCISGYTLQNGQCLIIQKKDPNCIQYDGRVCLYCADKFWLSGDRCVSVTGNCLTYQHSTGNCISCNNQYRLINYTCIRLANPNDNYCLRIDSSGICIECAYGYYLDSSTSWNSSVSASNTVASSESSCKSLSQLCITFDYSIKQCIQCVPGYFLQDGFCIYPSLGYDSFCVRLSGSYCVSCKQGYYLRNYVCVRIPQNCREFNNSTMTCTQCSIGRPQGARCV